MPESSRIPSRLVRPFAVGVVTCILVFCFVRPATAEQVRVRGASAVQTSLTSRGRELELTGRVSDEAGRALPNAAISLELHRETAAAEPTSCAKAPESRRPLERRGARHEYYLLSDAEGRFCVALGGEGGGMARVRAIGDRLHEPSDFVSTELAPDKHELDLSFVPEPKVIELEQPMHTFGITARLLPPLPHAPVLVELWLQPEGVAPVPLGSTTVQPGKRATLSVPSSRLGQPGLATLIQKHAGSDVLRPAERQVRVERTTRVLLSLGASIKPTVKGEAFPLEVIAQSALGPVPGGAVEALWGATSVGIAPVRKGTARVLATVHAPDGQVAPVTLRYLPDLPGWLPGKPLVVEIPVRPLSPWRGAPWMAIALGIGVWLARTWRRPARRVAPSPEGAHESAGRASIELVEPGPAQEGWHGTVRDAHDGQCLAGVSVTIWVPSFGSEAPAAQAVTDRDGNFALPNVDLGTEGTRVEVHATWHVTLGRPLPPPGLLLVHLVLRRRALLDRLLDWARRVGRPWWTGRQEPTPGDLAGVGRRHDAENVTRWAEAVERAAYGPGPVDEAEEQQVRRLEPHG